MGPPADRAVTAELIRLAARVTYSEFQAKAWHAAADARADVRRRLAAREDAGQLRAELLARLAAALAATGRR
jgi:hypothetical protein